MKRTFPKKGSFLSKLFTLKKKKAEKRIPRDYLTLLEDFKEKMVS